jgi:glutathione synthase/RimK-type ligase-like ATP-grasp enzyme
MSGPVAIYTCQAFPDLWEDDQTLLPALTRLGVEALPQRWDQPPRARYRAGLLRSTWDYYLHLPAFQAFLDAQQAPLFNDAQVVRWNLDKRYLLTLADLGVPIVPTRCLPALDAEGRPAALPLDALWQEFGELVIKPTISAGSWRTLRLPQGAPLPQEEPTSPGPRAYLVQPFLPQIAEGEWSLIFLGGAFSHAVRKRPAPGEFRVQEMFGGRTTPAAAPPWMIAAAQDVLAALPGVPALAGAAPPLYARVDGVEADGKLLLMELELIEPALFLRLAAGAADRLARALAQRLAR